MFKKSLSMIVILSFIFSSLAPYRQAQAIEGLGLPTPGAMVNLSPAYMPVLMKGIRVHPDNPLLFDFILDTGNSGLKISSDDFRIESQKLIKYFLASLTIKEEDLWVNLSPYEKDRMIPKELGTTEMGRDMLAEDYILKQLTASLIYPEKALGKKFWDGVYTKAREMYGVTDIPVNTFNKVWIVADKAKILERNNTAYVVGAHLKVMLEEDYVALGKQTAISVAKGLQAPATHTAASEVIRQVILPELEKEVNKGQNFARLRQMFYSMILATWYKTELKNALLNQVYSNKAKISGVLANDPQAKEKIYRQYLKAYKKGVFNYIKEDIDTVSQQVLPRKYFSGGLKMNLAMATKVGHQLELGDDVQSGGSMAMISSIINGFQRIGALATTALAVLGLTAALPAVAQADMVTTRSVVGNQLIENALTLNFETREGLVKRNKAFEALLENGVDFPQLVTGKEAHIKRLRVNNLGVIVFEPSEDRTVDNFIEALGIPNPDLYDLNFGSQTSLARSDVLKRDGSYSYIVTGGRARVLGLFSKVAVGRDFVVNPNLELQRLDNQRDLLISGLKFSDVEFKNEMDVVQLNNFQRLGQVGIVFTGEGLPHRISKEDLLKLMGLPTNVAIRFMPLKGSSHDVSYLGDEALSGRYALSIPNAYWDWESFLNHIHTAHLAWSDMTHQEGYVFHSVTFVGNPYPVVFSSFTAYRETGTIAFRSVLDEEDIKKIVHSSDMGPYTMTHSGDQYVIRAKNTNSEYRSQFVDHFFNWIQRIDLGNGMEVKNPKPFTDYLSESLTIIKPRSNISLPALPSTKIPTTTTGEGNPPMATPLGGIDLNAKNMNWDVDGKGIVMKFDPAMMAEFQRGNFTGVEGTILKIIPIESPLPLLDLQMPVAGVK